MRLLALLILFVSFSSYAQIDNPAEICPAGLSADEQSACEDYIECRADNVGNTAPQCAESFLHDMLTGCTDEICQRDRLFKSALIEFIQINYFWLGMNEQFDETQSDIEFIMSNLINPDSYENIHTNYLISRLIDNYIGGPDPYLYYASALVYEMFDNPELALEQYALVIELDNTIPIIYYSRAQLYLSIGEDDLASRDFQYFLNLQRRGSYDLTDILVVPLNTNEQTTFQSWTLYDVVSISHNLTDPILVDNITNPGRELEIQWLDEGNTLLYREVDNLNLLYLNCAGLTCSYTLDDGYDAFTIYSLEFSSSHSYAYLTIQDVASESISTSYGIILPSEVDDPRPPVSCEHGAYSWLIGEEYAYAFSELAGGTIYSEPNLESEIQQNSRWYEAEITGELYCNEVGNWWQATNELGTSGWILESEGTSHTFVPLDFVLILPQSINSYYINLLNLPEETE